MKLNNIPRELTDGSGQCGGLIETETPLGGIWGCDGEGPGWARGLEHVNRY